MADKALVISCVDERYVDIVDNFMKKVLPPGSYFKLLFPGACLGFVTYPDAMEYSIDLLLPSISTIYILDHYDCKAYQHQYKTSDTEIHHHIQNMINAVNILRTRTSVPIYCYLVNPDESVVQVDLPIVKSSLRRGDMQTTQTYSVSSDARRFINSNKQ